MVLINESGPGDRLVALIAGLGVGVAVGVVMALPPVIGEHGNPLKP